MSLQLKNKKPKKRTKKMTEKEFLNSTKDRARRAYQNYRDGAISRSHLFVHLEQGSLFDDATELLIEQLDSVREDYEVLEMSSIEREKELIEEVNEQAELSLELKEKLEESLKHSDMWADMWAKKELEYHQSIKALRDERDQLRQKNIELEIALETAQKSNPKIAILITDQDYDQKVMIGSLSDLFRKLLQEGILDTEISSVKEIEAYMVGDK